MDPRKILAIEKPEGLFRPDNIKLVHQIFRKEDLYNQHRTLLKRNEKAPLAFSINTKKNEKLMKKVQAFLSSSIG